MLTHSKVTSPQKEHEDWIKEIDQSAIEDMYFALAMIVPFAICCLAVVGIIIYAVK